MHEKLFWVYLLANRPRGAIYLGVTSNLVKRVWEHRLLEIPGHTRKYKITQLVWFEQHASAEAAIGREKQMKKWKREWKVALIEGMNPTWKDLYEDALRNQPF
ncbi:GIY-YIG nuclease family protein [Euryhalocaulis caribicus]|uniref:GIY-YIG nuclease family protein n=1 Tax=Euryhalocaulis caribicus TaxID=1161401 RepID=UPI00039EE473|nr:GIY-YIG nuclease family protein [Euryhalocaulis caribicus]